MSGLTESLARFTADPGFQVVPQEAARIVTTGFIDTVATILAGRDEPVTGTAASPDEVLYQTSACRIWPPSRASAA